MQDTVAGTSLQAYTTGPAGTFNDIQDIGERDRVTIEVVTVVVLLVILLVVYRNPLTMLLPLITIGVALLAAQGVVAGLGTLGLSISNQTIVLMTAMMFGAGVDYAVFLISRYHDYLRLRPDLRHRGAQLADLGRQGDRRVGVHRRSDLHGHGVHQADGVLHRGGGTGRRHPRRLPGRGDVPAGPAGAGRPARLGQAAQGSDHPILAALGNPDRAPPRGESHRQHRGPRHPGRRAPPWRSTTTTTARRYPPPARASAGTTRSASTSPSMPACRSTS